MTELPLSEKNKAPRPWILQTFGLAFGLAVLLIVIVVVAVMALESPSSRRAAAVQAAPLAAVTPAGVVAAAAPEQAATKAPTATAGPTQTPVARQAIVSAPTQTEFDISLPVVAYHGKRAIAQSPTRTPLPTATATKVETPLPPATVRSVARSVVATRSAVPKSSAPVQRLPAVTVTPIRPLDFHFYVKEYCATERSRQILNVVLTGHGGVPPYTYYNDATQIDGPTNGTVIVKVKAAYGNPVPFKLIVVDKTGQRYSETFFWKSIKRCSWKPQ